MFFSHINRAQLRFLMVFLVPSALLSGTTGCGGGKCPAGTTMRDGLCYRTPVDAGTADGGGRADGGARNEDGSMPDDEPTARAGTGALANGVQSASGGGTGASPAGSGSVDIVSAAGTGATPGSGQAAMPVGGQAAVPAAAGASSTSTTSDDPCFNSAGRSICDGAVMRHCNAAGVTSVQEPCANPTLCQLGTGNGACAVCLPGTFRCDGAALQHCTDGSSFELAENCASVELCKENAGACTQLMCMPDVETCGADDKLRSCNADGSAFKEQDCGPGLCDQQNARCNKCSPGSTQCESQTVVTCSADGQTVTSIACRARNDCTLAGCAAGSCTNEPKPTGSACSSGVCDGSGQCVQCVSSATCGTGMTCDLVSHTCKVKPCGDGKTDFGAGENCDPKDPAWAGDPLLCDASCHVTPFVWRKQCSTPGEEPWPGSGEQGWLCNGTHTTSRFCDIGDVECPGAKCLHYINDSGQVLNACGIPCTPGGAGCPTGLICTQIPGQGRQGSTDMGTCGY